MIWYVENESQTEFPKELFQHPTADYRGIPFWSWNCEITKEKIDQGLDVFQKMGFGGADIHPRVGLDTEFLSDKFHSLVAYAVEQAKKRGMCCWLYDDDRYPSGAADGLVTKDDHYRGRFLLLTEQRKQPDAGYMPDAEAFEQALASGLHPEGYFVTAYEICLEDGILQSYHRFAEIEEAVKAQSAGKRIRYAYVQLMPEGPAFGGEAYVDTMNPAAIARFLEVSHASYEAHVGEEFGKTIPAIFTDEPRIGKHVQLSYAESHEDVTIPYTEYFAEEMKRRTGIDPLDVVPEYIWQLKPGSSYRNRYLYRDVAAECFASAYMDQIAEWCGQHGIQMTGHIMGEDTLEDQVRMINDCMRCYRKMDIPGMDLLLDAQQFNTAKQVVSVARQNGKKAVVSELYGVTNWDCDFKTFKVQGDWQAALGVTLRIPHLAHMSLAGEAKRDWPGSIFWQAPWYEKFAPLEDHFARLNTVLTRGVPVVNVAVIHPVESMWMLMGPNDQTKAQRVELDAHFSELTNWLLRGGIDFDFISEALLPQQCDLQTDWKAGKLPVGKMQYQTILVPGLRTIRATTLERLERFQKQGGQVIFLGEIPELVDGIPNERAKDLAEQCVNLEHSRPAILKQLEQDRTVWIQDENRQNTEHLLHQLRQDAKDRWLFVCQADRKKQNILQAENCCICVRGTYKAEWYDTETGKIQELSVTHQNGKTYLHTAFYGEDSILIRLSECEANVEEQQSAWKTPEQHPVLELKQPVSYHLEEPNVLLLDRASWQLDEEEEQEEMDILRIDTAVRAKLDWEQRGEHMQQPYCMEERETHKLTLTYVFDSEVEADVQLALEELPRTELWLNGERVERKKNGWYLDPAIFTVKLPKLRIGKNTLTVRIFMNQKTNLEAMYLLGTFGVDLRGTNPVVTDLLPKLQIGDITRQRLPFYTGNYEMHFPIEIEQDGQYELQLPIWKAPLLGVRIDEGEEKIVAYAPHRAKLGFLSAGSHELIVRVYGNRFNVMGALHNADDYYVGFGPDSYHTTGEQWTDTYRVRPVGLLAAPQLERREQ